MKPKHFRRLMLAAAALPLTAAAAGAQSTTQGAIAGTVFDATNAAVPGASVTIRNDGTNAEFNLTTDGSGYYKAPQLQPGTYTVTVKASGFSEAKSDKVVVELNTVTEVSPHLTTGAESSVVEVTAEVPVLNFDSPEYGGHLSNLEIENIPINNRRWSSLALLTPGVSNDASGFGLISFRAISAVLNNVEIDGADDNQAFYGEERGRTRAGYSTSQIAIREFQVNTGVYSAEFGRAVGGVINSVTKSGTNQIHGELYFYHRDSQWGAFNNYTLSTAYDPTTGITTQGHLKPKDKRNQYGFGIGGPIIKDKLFGFYAFDQFRRTFPGAAKANSASVFSDPNAAQLNLLVSRGIAATPAAALTTYRSYISQFVGDLGLVPRYGFQTINTPKLDYQINQKNHASILYHRLRWDSPGGVQTQNSNAYSRDSYGTDFVKLDYTLAELDTLITTHLTNSVRYQYGRELNDEGRQPNTALTNQYFTPASGVPVQISLPSNAFQVSQQYYSFRNALPDERKWQIGDTAIYQIGNHSIKFGVDILHNYDLQNFLGSSSAPPNGNFNYGTNPNLTGTTAAAGPGSAFLNIVSDLVKPAGSCEAQPSGTAPSGVGTFGCFSSYTQSIGPAIFDLSTLDQGYFLQDDWKFRPNLTFNLGVRYDFENLPPAYAALLNPATPIPGLANLPSDKNNISPRVGFAWDPYKNGKTAVRGGFGMYYGHIPNALLLGIRTTTGSTNGQLPVTVYNNSTTAPTRLPTPPSAAQLAGTPPSPSLIAQNFQNPYTEQFDLAVQQDLGRGFVLSVAYLGSLGRELPNFLNLNLDPAATYNVNYTVAQTAAGSNNCGVLACGTAFPVKVYSRQKYTSATASTNDTLIPQYNAITTVTSNVNSSFHAMTVEMQKRAGKYVSFDANYTWSHALDYNQNQSTGISTNNFFDPYGNGRANYSNSNLDIRHRAVGWAIFNLPGYRRNALTRAFTDGFSFKPAVQIQTGLPYSATVSNSAPNSCTTAQLTATTTSYQGCLVSAGTGLSGTGVTYIPYLGRNTFTLPRDILVDLRIQKDFKVHEGYSLQLIGESFNLANHQNVTGINSGAYTIGSGTANSTGVLTPVTSFGTVTNTNNNFAYGPRTIQAGARLFF